MFELLNKWSLEPKSSNSPGNAYQLPTFKTEFVECSFFDFRAERCVLPLLHAVLYPWEVNEFSKVEKKIVANQQNSCKGFQCNRVDPITNPLILGVTL